MIKRYNIYADLFLFMRKKTILVKKMGALNNLFSDF